MEVDQYIFFIKKIRRTLALTNESQIRTGNTVPKKRVSAEEMATRMEQPGSEALLLEDDQNKNYKL